MQIKFFLFIFLLIPGLAQAWWNEDWPYRAKITLDTSLTGTHMRRPVQEATVLLRLHTGNFSDFFYLREDVGDLRFISSDDTQPLKYHIEKFDLINQMMFVWIKLPEIKAEDSSGGFWMYYGNQNASSAEDSAATFDINQTGVFHFSGQNNIVIDNTAYGQKASIEHIERVEASVIGSGLRFSENSVLKIQPSPSLQYLAGKGFAFSGWIKTTSIQKNSHIFSHKTAQGTLLLGIEKNNLYLRWENLQGEVYQTPATAALTPGRWQHIGLNIDSSRPAIYINGIEMSSINFQLPSFPAGELLIGGKPPYDFIGELDEVSLSGVSRSPDWYLFVAGSQGAQSDMLSVAKPEQLSGTSGVSYFSSILKSVSLDGWVVIGMLMVMSAISWLVMFSRTLMLNRMKKDNALFINDFHSRKTSDDPSVLDSANDNTFDDSFVNTLFGKHDHYQSSPLYHMYHQGVQELNQRLGRSVGACARNSLSPQAISAIRASLDASLVREAQKLNAQMVLLTIAIAGGPFLGLLGTVLGVMITFAAIAISGSVDINAIAPGVSAALMTTVAGLFVAIPALFGYNYLSVRISDMLSSMHVFVDEFIAKIAEHYSREL